MAILIVRPSSKPTELERKNNRAIIERYMPEFMEWFLEARQELGARLEGEMRFRIPAEDLDFVKSVMDDTKELVM